MLESNSQHKSYVGSLLFFVFVAAGVFAGFLFRQDIVDAYWVWQYKPTAVVMSIRDDLDLTPAGEYLFNASRPELQQASTFNDSCGQKSETNNPILGCYVRQSIYVYDVTNKKLSGIEETTAAHELLHAVYERMSPSEQEQIDALVMQAYQKVKTPELEKRMAYYQKSEPGEEANELHSILGTEFSNLGGKLEAHYGTYFKTRKNVLHYYQTYSSVFGSVTKKLESLSNQINSLTSKIKQEIASYTLATSALSTDVRTFNERTFTSQSDFNAARSSLVARQNDLDQEHQEILAEINQINALKNEYNTLVDEYNDLNRSINSSLAPTPSL